MLLYIKCSFYCRWEYGLSAVLKGQVNHNMAALLFALTGKTERFNWWHIKWIDKLYCTDICMTVCVRMCIVVSWRERSSSVCADRSTVCGVLQHQQPDRGQTVDLWCQRAEMTCFCHWVCAPSREALNYIGRALTDMFVIQSLLKIPSKRGITPLTRPPQIQKPCVS